jgi:hypothetical protein
MGVLIQQMHQDKEHTPLTQNLWSENAGGGGPSSTEQGTNSDALMHLIEPDPKRRQQSTCLRAEDFAHIASCASATSGVLQKGNWQALVRFIAIQLLMSTGLTWHYQLQGDHGSRDC